MEQQGGLLGALLPLLITSGSIGVSAYFLAKNKERNVILWTVLGCIPFINFITMMFFSWRE